MRQDEFEGLLNGTASYDDSKKRTARSNLWKLWTDKEREVDQAKDEARLSEVAATEARKIAARSVREVVRLEMEIERITAKAVGPESPDYQSPTNQGEQS